MAASGDRSRIRSRNETFGVVQTLGGLVEEQHVGVVHDRPGERHPLPLPPRQTPGQAAGEVTRPGPLSASPAASCRSRRGTPESPARYRT